MIRLNELRIGGVLLTGGHVFQSATAFAINLLLVRYITPSEFGWFAIVFAEASLFYAVLSIRTNALIIRISDEDYTENTKDVYFNAALQETLVATVLIFAWLWFSRGVNGWETVIVLTLAVRHWMVINRAFYERGLPYKQLSIIETGSALLGQGVALVGVLMGIGWIALILREAVATLSGLFGLSCVNGLTFRRVRLLTRAEYRQLYAESRGIWLDGVLEGTFQRLTIMAAGYFGGDALAGIIFQAQRLATVPHQFLAPFVNRIAYNWFSRIEDSSQRLRTRNKVVAAIVLPLLVVAALTIMYAGQLVPWLLGETWAEVSVLLAGMAGFIIFSSPFEILRSYSFVIRRSRLVLLSRLAQHAGFAVPVGMALIGSLSIADGLAYGFSFAYAAAFLILWFALALQDRKTPR